MVGQGVREKSAGLGEVGGFVEKCVDFGNVGRLDFKEPASAVGVGVDEAGFGGGGGVDLGDLAGDGGVDVAGGFD